MFKKFLGLTYFQKDIATSLKILSEQISVRQQSASKHTVLHVEGFGERDTLEATAVYLVGAIASAIAQNLRINEVLYDDNSFGGDLQHEVRSIIRDENAEKEYKIHSRDPWLWEAISHMFMHLSVYDTAFHPSGRILAKSSIKHDVHDHGLDMIAVYSSGVIGISAGECKAYLEDPSRGIADAASKLSEVDLNLRDKEIRSTVVQLQYAIPASKRRQIAGAFWRQERSYFPLIFCDTSHECRWERSRKSLNKLMVPPEKRILIPLSIAGARQTMDSLCTLMRYYVEMVE